MFSYIRKTIFGKSEDLGTLDPTHLSTDLEQRLVRRLFTKNPQIEKFSTNDTHTVDLNGVSYHFKLSNELLRVRDTHEPKKYEILVLPTPQEEHVMGDASVDTRVIQAKGLLKPALGGQLVFDGDKKLVAKIMHHSSQKTIEDVQREAKISQQASQEVSTPTVIYHGPNAATTYMMMAFLPGENLEKLLNDSQKRNALTVDQRFKMTIDLLIALQQVHDRGIIHRDLKPDNIRYCEKTGKIIIYDFGISKMKNDDRQEEDEVLGSVGYAPKEQAIQTVGYQLVRWNDEVTTLEQNKIYVRITDGGGLEYKVLNPHHQEVTGTIEKEKFASLLANAKKHVNYDELQKEPLDVIQLARALPELRDTLAKEGHVRSRQEEAQLVQEQRKVDETSDGYSVGKVLSELWEVPHESASIQSEEDRLKLHTLREHDTQFNLSSEFEQMDLDEKYKERIIEILEQMTKADRGERLSVDDALAQFEQINIERNIPRDSFKNNFVEAVALGRATRDALREEIKKPDTNIQKQVKIVKDALTAETEDKPRMSSDKSAVIAFVDALGVSFLKGSETIEDIERKLNDVEETKTNLEEKSIKIGRMVNLLSTFGSSSTLLYKILKSISSDIERANKENSLFQISSVESFQKHITNINESISKLHTIYNPDSIHDEKNIGQIMEQILTAPSTNDESLKQLQALVKSGILLYINSTYSKINIKTEKRAASEMRMVQMLDILKIVNEAESIDDLKDALQDKLKTVKSDSFLANIPVLKKLTGSQLATHIESAIKLHEIADRRREMNRKTI